MSEGHINNAYCNILFMPLCLFYIYIYILYVISSNFKELLRSLVGDGRTVWTVSCFKTQTPKHQGYIKVFCSCLTKKSSKTLRITSKQINFKGF